jgi:hypothetical protein
MDDNELDPGSAPSAPGVAEHEASPSKPRLRDPSWRAAKTAFRLVTYVIGPISAGLLIIGLIPTALGLGAGRGFGVPTLVPRAVGFYLASVVLGMTIGALLGFVGALIARDRRLGRTGGSWWAAANRPISLFPRRRGDDTAAGGVEARPRWWRKPRAAAPADPASGSPGRRRWPIAVGVIALLLLAMASLAGAYAQRTVGRRLADAIAAADRDDPNWRIDDLMAHRQPVPDAENSALIVAEALEYLPENWPTGPAPPPGQHAPPPTEASRAYDRMSAMADYVRLDKGTADSLAAGLKEYGEAVRIARTVADYPRGRHELELGPTLIDTLLPETQATRGVARLLAADAALRAHGGAFDEALDSCRALLGTGRSIGDEPCLISQLVRIAIGAVAMKSTRRVLAQGEPSDAALARLQSLIVDELGQPLLLHGMRGERAIMTEMIRRVGAGEIPISALSDSRTAFDPGSFRAAIAPWGRLWFDNQRAVALEWSNDAVAIARRPLAEGTALWDAWEARIARVKESRFGIYTATLPLLMTPALRASSSAFSRYQAELGAAATFLAAERHRRKAGAWPESVAAIERDLLPKPPLDPFSGQPFRMEHRDGRLFVYSIGPDRVDEHGEYNVIVWGKGGPDDVGAIGWDMGLRGRPAWDEVEESP